MSKRFPATALVTNRRALRNFEVVDTFEAGIALKGCEVKSIRSKHVTLEDSFAQVERGEVWMHNMRIEAYSHSVQQYNPPTDRQRRLLLNKTEIKRLTQQTHEKGLTLIPLSLYTKDRLIKVQLCICRGKNVFDKRETLKKRTSERETQREIRNANQRG